MGSEKRGKGSVKPALDGFRVFVVAVVTMVIAVVVVGLYLAGSPNKERARRFDQQRLNDLQSITYAVDFFYDNNRRLPDSLSELATGSVKGQYYVSSIVDPESGVPYEYVVKGGADYDLCAIFALPSTESDPSAPYPARPVPAGIDSDGTSKPLMPVNPWEHPAGRHCFGLNAEQHVVRDACSLTNPCQAGQNCVSLPDRKGSYCVPAGKECLAAGCPNNQCAVMESYPAQVRCTPGESTPPPAPSNCQLMKEKSSGRVDCFGCGTRVCKDPALGWESYTPPKDAMGIPYACYVDDDGACALAQ